MASIEETIPGIASQIESFKRSDKAREELLQDIIAKYESLLKENTDLSRDLKGERMMRRHYQDHIDRSELQLAAIENNSFVLALIDGDGVIFQDIFLKAVVAAEGGSAAASKLQQAIQEHIASIYDNTKHWSISVNIYVSLDKLGQKLANVGLLNQGQDFRAFAQGFNVNRPLFNIVDVGQGKERADNKLRETLRIFIDNPTCKHIIFGGCHDAGYLNSFEPYKHDQVKAERISLLETTPYYSGFNQLSSSFKRTRFDSVFRSDPLPDSSHSTQSPKRRASVPLKSDDPISRPISNKPSVPIKTEAVASPKTSRTATPTSHASDPPSESSWATAGKNGTGTINISIAPKQNKKEKKKYAYYNKDGFRLDEPLPPLDKAANEAIHQRTRRTGKNLCNAWHLNGVCKDNWCKFQHEPKLLPSERGALRYKARTLSCKDRACEDINCILGHQCPNERDLGYCKFGIDCNFRFSHGMDQAKYERWDEDGNVVIRK